MLIGDCGGTCLSVPGSEVHPSYPWQPGLGDRTPPKRKLHRASQSSLRYRQLDPHRGLRLTPGGPSEGTLHTDPSVPPPSPSSRSSIRAELQASSGQPQLCRAVHVLVEPPLSFPRQTRPRGSSRQTGALGLRHPFQHLGLCQPLQWAPPRWVQRGFHPRPFRQAWGSRTEGEPSHREGPGHPAGRVRMESLC